MPSTRRNHTIVNTINPTPLRRSHRLHQQQQQSAHKKEVEDQCSRSPKSKSRTSDSVTRKSIAGSGNFEVSTSGLRRSPRFSNGVDPCSCLRRSPRYFFDTDKAISKSRIDTRVRAAVKEVKLSSKKAKTGVNSCPKVVKKGKMKVQVEGFTSVRRSPRLSNKDSNAERDKKAVIEREKNRVRVESDKVTVEVGEKKARVVDEKIVGVKRKRKKNEVDYRISNGWTKGEEAALQRAYLVVKPTPHFWKNVAKLVPGKSAQDCFNKVHSDQLTPLQAQPRSRINKPKTSPLGHLSLSASKLLKPIELNIKRPRYNKPKSHIVQKAARHLLRRHYDVDQDHEADLFSVLEQPHSEPSIQNISPSFQFSTPKHERKSTGLSPIFEKSSSNCKHSLSRFSSSCPGTIISPPVLKQVKNKALHEKYIDQLHIREAKRKAASTQAAKSTLRMGNRKEKHHFQTLDEVKAVLVSEAKDAIDLFQHLQNNLSVNSSEEDDDGVATDSDDES